MALIPRILEVSRDHTGHAYVLVEFRERRGGPVVLTEEFVMQLSETRQEMVLDDRGEVVEVRDVPVDVRAEMSENIRRFVDQAEAKGWRGDMTEGLPGVQTRQRDKADNTGVVRTLKADVGTEVPPWTAVRL